MSIPMFRLILASQASRLAPMWPRACCMRPMFLQFQARPLALASIFFYYTRLRPPRLSVAWSVCRSGLESYKPGEATWFGDMVACKLLLDNAQPVFRV